eukprot:12935382-Prorocentrum_lima.AAC.1
MPPNWPSQPGLNVFLPVCDDATRPSFLGLPSAWGSQPGLISQAALHSHSYSQMWRDSGPTFPNVM